MCPKIKDDDVTDKQMGGFLTISGKQSDPQIQAFPSRPTDRSQAYGQKGDERVAVTATRQ